MGLRNWGHGTLVAEWRYWKGPNEGPLIAGTVTVQNPLRVTNRADEAIIPAGKLVDKLPLNTEEDTEGDERSIEIILPATDDPDLHEAHPGFTVTVALDGFGTETYSGVLIPEDGVTDLLDLIPTTRASIPTASLNLGMFARIENGLIVDVNGDPVTWEPDYQPAIDIITGEGV